MPATGLRDNRATGSIKVTEEMVASLTATQRVSKLGNAFMTSVQSDMFYDHCRLPISSREVSENC